MVSANVCFDENIFPNKPQMSLASLVCTTPVPSSSKLSPPSYLDYISVPWINEDEPIHKSALQVPTPPTPPPAPLLAPPILCMPSLPPFEPSLFAVELPTSAPLQLSQSPSPGPHLSGSEPNSTIRRSKCKGKALAYFPAVQSADISTKC